MSKTSKPTSTPQVHTTRLRDRFQYSPPWRVTRWGFGFRPINRGSDEWGNPSLYLVLPLLGSTVFFYSKDLDRSKWFLDGAMGRVALYTSPDFKHEACVRFNGDFDALFDEAPLLTNEEIQARAYRIDYIAD